MNPEFLVDGVLRSVLGGRKKKSKRALKYLTRDLTRGVGSVGRMAGGLNRSSGGFMTRPSTLLGALGVAWGIYETLQNQGTPAAPSGAATPGAGQWGLTSSGGSGVPAPGGAPVQQTPLPPLPNIAGAAQPSPDALA